MKVENLAIGQVVKNYKELCTLLEIDIKSGASKRSQLKEMERYFKYEKEKYKFVITDIYSTPLPPNNNITKYIPLIEQLILHIIVEESDSDNRLYINRNKLLNMLKMINEQYSKMKYRNMQLSYKYNIPKETILDFYSTSDSLLKRNLETALNNLQDRSLIQWSNVFSVCELEIINAGISHIEIDKEIDKYGDIETTPVVRSKKVNRIHREATKEEERYILYMQRETLKAMECESISEVMRKGLSKDFYDRVNSALLMIHNIEMYYTAYSIRYNIYHVTERYENANVFLLDDESRELTAQLLNNEIMDKINSNATDRHNKALKGMGSFSVIGYRSDKEYTTHIKTLSNRLISNKE